MATITTTTSLFEQYYAKINLFNNKNDEDNAKKEWENAVEILKTPLPVSFRWNSAIDFQDKVNNQKYKCKRPLLENNIRYKELDFVDAWELNVDAKSLQNDIDKKKAFRWIVAQTRSGVISRQEVASMIPVSLLNIEKNHRVLDLCASPGSKTRQALENLCHSIAIKNDDLGIVIANDVNLKRSFIIANRCNVLGLHTQRLCVTNHKAQSFPNISIKASINNNHNNNSDDDDDDEYNNQIDGQYDRIVCDVPCSGDGTLRKDPIIWQRWHPEFSMELHPLQIQIAMRGLSLLKVGGIMAYSTCTFNPIENEAVVSELLRRCGNSVKIIKCELNGFKVGSGISSWPVYDDEMNEWTLDGFKESLKKQKEMKKNNNIHQMYKLPPILPTMFPSNQKKLSRCLRIFPHYNNTGGFFVCLLKKVKPLKIIRKKQGKKKVASSSSSSIMYKQEMERIRKQSRLRNGQIYHEVPLNQRKAILKQFNTNITRRAKMYSRSSTFKQIFLTSSGLSNFCFNSPGSDRLHVVNAGTLVFQKKRNRRNQQELNSAKDEDDYYEPYKKLRKRVKKVLL